MAAAAANTYRRGLVGFVKQIRIAGRSSTSSFPSSLALSRSCSNVVTEVYEKNIDELDTPAIVPDNIVQPDCDKYWAPDPETGVFGPASEIDPSAPGSESATHCHGNGGEKSVLDQKAFIRSVDVQDKPVEGLETTPQL